MDVSQFAKEIGSGARKPFYLALGEDPEAQESVVAAAKKAVNPGFFDFNFQSFKTEGVDWGQIMEMVGTAPFFLPPRVVIIRREKYLQAELDKLAKYLENPNPDNVIVLSLDTLGEKPVKFFKEAFDKGLWIDCQAPQKNELPSWLIRKAAAKGVTLARDGAVAMIDRMGDNLGLLLSDLEKLSLYPGPGTNLGAPEIAKLVSLGATAVVYELGEPLATDNPAEAVKALLDLADGGTAFSLLSIIENHFLRLYKFKISLETANPESLKTARPLGFHPFYFQKLRQQANNWPWGRLAQGIEAIFRAHRSLVTLPTPPMAVVENLTLALTVSLRRAKAEPAGAGDFKERDFYG
jgi:DNA polymerase-3 subunit delta